MSIEKLSDSILREAEVDLAGGSTIEAFVGSMLLASRPFIAGLISIAG